MKERGGYSQRQEKDSKKEESLFFSRLHDDFYLSQIIKV